jgi:hypothetical protein
MGRALQGFNITLLQWKMQAIQLAKLCFLSKLISFLHVKVQLLGIRSFKALYSQ